MAELLPWPPSAPAPWSVVQVRSMSEVALLPRSAPQGAVGLVGTKETVPELPVPAETSFALLFTLIDAPAPRETMAQGCTVTVAVPVMAMVPGTRLVTPFPGQLSLAEMFTEWVTVVPVGGPQPAAPV